MRSVVAFDSATTAKNSAKVRIILVLSGRAYTQVRLRDNYWLPQLVWAHFNAKF